MIERITSTKNDRVKHLVRLRERSHRKRQQRFLIEGLREIRRALLREWPLESLYFCEDLFSHPDALELLDEVAKLRVECIPMSSAAFARAALRQGPDGLLAVARTQSYGLADFHLSARPLLVVAEGIEKPGNLGAILRTANAAGADAVVFADCVTDPFNPNAIRASQGAIFDIPFAATTTAAVIEYLSSKHIQPVLLRPDAPRSLWQCNLTGPIALLLGAEDAGLQPIWNDTCRAVACSLPMRGVSDSLNVAATAAIALFEAVRQRENNG
jgi:TrmH family RNA methyltransferase